MPEACLAHWAKIVKQNLSEYEGEVIGSHPIHSAETIFNLLRDRSLVEDVEHFYVVCLDACRRIKGIAEVARGGNRQVVLDMKEIFRVAVAYGADSIVMCHNHPSGDPTPSIQDINLTLRCIDAAKILDITIMDHVVIGTWNKWTSIFEFLKHEMRKMPPFATLSDEALLQLIMGKQQQ